MSVGVIYDVRNSVVAQDKITKTALLAEDPQAFKTIMTHADDITQNANGNCVIVLCHENALQVFMIVMIVMIYADDILKNLNGNC